MPPVIQTRNGRDLIFEEYPEDPPHVKAAYWRVHRQQHPSLQLRRDPTKGYNCFGLVLAVRRGWLERGVVEALRDDGYHPLLPNEQPFPGDIVVWFNGSDPAHIGVVMDIPSAALGFVPAPLILSKWGPGPEYLHRLGDSKWTEDQGYRHEFWTDRA
jgi:hypothetical protein